MVRQPAALALLIVLLLVPPGAGAGDEGGVGGSPRTLEPRPGVVIPQTPFIAKRYYPGRQGSALEAGSRPVLQHNNSGDGSENGRQYRELGEALVAACGKKVAASEVVRLLEAGADPSYLDDAGGRAGSKGHNTPLLQAIRTDDADKVGLLLAAGAQQVPNSTPHSNMIIRDVSD